MSEKIDLWWQPLLAEMQGLIGPMKGMENRLDSVQARLDKQEMESLEEAHAFLPVRLGRRVQG